MPRDGQDRKSEDAPARLLPCEKRNFPGPFRQPPRRSLAPPRKRCGYGCQWVLMPVMHVVLPLRSRNPKRYHYDYELLSPPARARLPALPNISGPISGARVTKQGRCAMPFPRPCSTLNGYWAARTGRTRRGSNFQKANLQRTTGLGVKIEARLREKREYSACAARRSCDTCFTRSV